MIKELKLKGVRVCRTRKSRFTQSGTKLNLDYKPTLNPLIHNASVIYYFKQDV